MRVAVTPIALILTSALVVEPSRLIAALYWPCWALLAILAAVIVLGWRRA